jgi:hypothetical protein
LDGSSEEKSHPSPQSAASQEAAAEALAKTLARESRKSAIVGFFSGVVVVVGLAATYYAFLQSRSNLQTQVAKTDSLQTEVHSKTAEVAAANEQAAATRAVFSATVENLQKASPSVSASTTAALNSAFDSNPNAAKLLVRVYIHLHSKEQKATATNLAHDLRAAGYLVPGVDTQPAQSYKATEVHYYANDSQSLSDIQGIMGVVSKAGINVDKRLVPPAGTDHLRPRAYGLWLAANLN